jgi:hypothetical protein
MTHSLSVRFLVLWTIAILRLTRRYRDHEDLDRLFRELEAAGSA